MGLIDHLRTIFARAPEKPAPPADSTPANSQDRRKHPRIDARKGTRVLIIDDSPTVLTFLKKVFTSAGYVPLVAGNAERGLQIARSAKPDLVVLDVIMPGMNGFAALRQIRRDPEVQHLPVIMMSGNEQATEQFYVMRIGADSFMSKPFSRFDIFSRIERMLDENLVPRRIQA
ncbi:MAG: response regulator [Hydrogenophilales bacterium 28-61-23]|nr:MAG: response regulator [Hydrogenophilales bacterium 28-61-23]